MLERYTAIIRDKIEEVRQMLMEADFPAESIKEITANLDLMEQIISQYE